MTEEADSASSPLSSPLLLPGPGIQFRGCGNCLPLSPECTPSLPYLSCPFFVLPALASQPAAPWLLLRFFLLRHKKDLDPRGKGSGNHNHGSFRSLNAWGGASHKQMRLLGVVETVHAHCKLRDRDLATFDEHLSSKRRTCLGWCGHPRLGLLDQSPCPVRPMHMEAWKEHDCDCHL